MRETLWLGSRYGLAAFVTTMALAALPCLISVAVGLVVLALGVFSTVVLPFGADPPIFGLAFGLAVIATSIIGTLAAIVAILTITFIVSAGIITPVALLIRLLAGNARSPALAAVLFLLAGVILGLTIGAVFRAIGAAAPWQITQSSWSVGSVYVLGLAIGIAATSVYGGVLLATETVRAGIQYALDRWFRRKSPGTTHP